MVHFPGFARARLWIHRAVRGFYPRGFPHSEIPGSKPACGSPRLIAACHVLHRLLLPRHPPCALSSLTTKFTQHTQEAFSLQLSAFSQNQPEHAVKISWASKPAPRMQHRFPSCTFVSLVVKAFGLFPARSLRHRRRTAPHTPAGISGTHKNLRSPCNCPIYSVVKYRPRQPMLTYPPQQVWVLLTSDHARF